MAGPGLLRCQNPRLVRRRRAFPIAPWGPTLPSDPHLPATFEFALRIAEIGGRARLLLPDHTAGRWCSVAEAIASGRSFMVRPRDDVLVLDGDVPDALDRLLQLAEKMRRAGLRPVVTASGTAGHGHLIAVIRDDHLLAKLRQAGRAKGFDVRVGTACSARRERRTTAQVCHRPG